MYFKVIILLCFLVQYNECRLNEIVKWRQITYKNFKISADSNNSSDSDFIQYNNVPQGFATYKDRMFVAVPRRRDGVPSTLNFIKLDGDNLQIDPPLESYPNVEMNELDRNLQANANRIVCVYRPFVDECGRLWFVDTGIIQRPAKVVIQRPSIWAIDLESDQVINRFEIPENLVIDGIGMASLTVDVVNTSDKCEETFVYIPDLFYNQMIVFSLKENHAWRVTHNYFHMNPYEGFYNVDGVKFMWEDGIFSIALGQRDDLNFGYRLAYFHPMSSTAEFAVSTEILRNETMATRSYHDEDFKFIGQRGQDSQSTIHGFDPTTGVIFFASFAKYGVSCWNTKLELKPKFVGLVDKDNETMIYLNDLKVDFEGNVWAMSNRMPRHIYKELDTNDFNFRIFKASSAELIKGTVCSNEGNLWNLIFNYAGKS